MNEVDMIKTLMSEDLDVLREKLSTAQKLEKRDRKIYETGLLTETAIKALNIIGEKFCSLIESYNFGFHDREILIKGQGYAYDFIITCYSESIWITYQGKRMITYYFDRERENTIYLHVTIQDVVNLCCQYDELYKKSVQEIKYLYVQEICRLQEERQKISERVSAQTKVLNDFTA